MFKVGQKVVRKSAAEVTLRWKEWLDDGGSPCLVVTSCYGMGFHAEGSATYWEVENFIPAQVKPFIAEDWL